MIFDESPDRLVENQADHDGRHDERVDLPPVSSSVLGGWGVAGFAAAAVSTGF
ncbi:hypothetical protein [Streptomyces sp. NPDC094049]|uniref:hypothetical protein n=1 Tax=Streptomyces sp. NPDC094049 TaxID=3154987 RepID=UPI00331F18AB